MLVNPAFAYSSPLIYLPFHFNSTAVLVGGTICPYFSSAVFLMQFMSHMIKVSTN